MPRLLSTMSRREMLMSTNKSVDIPRKDRFVRPKKFGRATVVGVPRLALQQKSNQSSVDAQITLDGR